MWRESKLTIIVLAAMLPKIPSIFIINGEEVSLGKPDSKNGSNSTPFTSFSGGWSANELQYEVVTRRGWGSHGDCCRYPRLRTLPKFVIIMAVEKVSGGPENSCDGDMRQIEFENIDEFGAHDVTANAYVCDDGLIFEGSGWGYESPLAGPLRHMACVIGVIGRHSDGEELPTEQRVMLKMLLKRNVEWGRIDPNYRIILEKQINPKAKTQSEALIWLIENMRRFNPGSFVNPKYRDVF